MLCAFVSITIYLLIIAFCSLRAETRAYVSTIVSKNCDSCWVTPQGHWKRVYRGPWRGAKLTIGKMAGKIVILKFRKERVAHATEIERAGFLTRARPSTRHRRRGAAINNRGPGTIPCPEQSHSARPARKNLSKRTRARAGVRAHRYTFDKYIYLHIYL